MKLLHLASYEMRRRKSSISRFPAVVLMEWLDRRPKQHSSLCVSNYLSLQSEYSLKQGLREKLILLLIGCCCSEGGSNEVFWCPWGSLLCRIQQAHVFPSSRVHISYLLGDMREGLSQLVCLLISRVTWTNKDRLMMDLENNKDSQEQSPGKKSLKRERLLSAYEYFWPLPVVIQSCKALLAGYQLVFLVGYRKTCNEEYLMWSIDLIHTSLVYDLFFLHSSA